MAMNPVAGNPVALVTGAGSGIGRAVALALAEANYCVVATGRRREPLEETASQASGAVTVMEADVSDPVSVQRLFRGVRARFRRLDVLFNNAGVAAPPVPYEEITPEQWTRVIDTNVTGVFLCAQAAYRLMKTQRPRGGRIINNGSVSAVTPRPNSAPYTASKHAVTGLTKALSLDGRQYDIACGQIDIGNAATGLARSMPTGVLQADLSIRTEPVFDVAHVAAAVLQMASLPLDVNVQFMTIMATAMPFIGRG
jgi:NAD(P)-dependent dehydrogenase (short-subunit alcohol dehydrogenase family)